MTDEEIIRHFDGRGRVHLQFPYTTSAEKCRRMMAIAHALGYKPLFTDTLGRREFPASMNATTLRTPANGPSKPSNGCVLAARRCQLSSLLRPRRHARLHPSRPSSPDPAPGGRWNPSRLHRRPRPGPKSRPSRPTRLRQRHRLPLLRTLHRNDLRAPA